MLKISFSLFAATARVSAILLPSPSGGRTDVIRRFYATPYDIAASHHDWLRIADVIYYFIAGLLTYFRHYWLLLSRHWRHCYAAIS